MPKESGFDSNGRRIPIHWDQEQDETDLRIDGVQFDPGNHPDLSQMDPETRQLCIAFAADAIWKFAILIADEKKPKRAIYAVLYACGAGEYVGGSGTAIAKAFGVSKQALFQQGSKILRSLGLRKAPLQKSEEAKEQYALSNHQNHKPTKEFEL